MDLERRRHLVDTYSDTVAQYQAFSASLERLIVDLLTAASVPLHYTESRAKEPNSLAKKLATKQKYHELGAVPDLCGVRVVFFYSGDVSRAVQLIRDNFDVLEEDPHQPDDPSKFGYASIHLIIKMKSVRSHLPEWQRFDNLHAEIQLRTILQHGWAAVSRQLNYKHESDVPKTILRELNLAAAQLEIADALLDKFRTEVVRNRASYDQTVGAEEWRNLPVDLDSIESAWSSLPVGEVERVAETAGFVRYDDDYLVEYRALLRLLAQAAITAGVSSLGALEKVMLRAHSHVDALKRIREIAESQGVILWSFAPDVVHMLLAIEGPSMLDATQRPKFQPVIEAALHSVAS